MQMTRWLDKRASLTPDRTALISSEGQLTYGELRARVMVTSRQLASLGVHTGDTVALLCRNGLHTPELIHAILYAGAVLMPLNTRLTAHEMAYQIEDATCRYLIYDDANGQLAEDILGKLPGLSIIEYSKLRELPQAADTPIVPSIDLDDVATIMYTSGTTGNPKGVIHTYGNHWASAIGSALNLGMSSEDMWLAAVPMFHISGLSILMRSVIYGMPIVIHEKFDAHQANTAIMEQGVTIVSVVSNMLTRMLEELGDRTYPPHFRCMLLGGGPAPLPLLEACVEKGIPVYQTYGMTETASQIVTLPPEYMLTKLGSAGKPLFQSEVRIMDERGEEAAPNAPGEIHVRGPNVTSGYWGRPDATSEVLRHGWLATGDIGYLDEEGFLYVLDRRKDLIISGGENIYPAEIESVLTGHPSVVEAGVTGIADERWGQVPVAFIVPRAGVTITAEELQRYCHNRLARYKIPAHIYIVDSLPRNAAGKLLRRELQTYIDK